jgi:hypothetical protein
MGIRPSAETGSGDGNQLAVDQIGEVYANVKTVADNIADVVNVSENLNQLEELGDVAALTLTNATNAANSAAAADASADAAQASQSAAAGSQTAAATSATTASTAAGNASTSATAAATSEANALIYRNAAQTAATGAASSEANALTYRNAAESFKNSASASAIAAALSETNAAASAVAAANSAATASTHKDSAAGSATAANSSATSATNSATLANTKAGEASASATTALAAKVAAEAARDAAEAIAGGDYVLGSEKGAANGVVPLGADTKISVTYLPDSVLGALKYQGTWNASTNSPAIPAAAAGNKGYYYIVSVAGTTSINGENDWQIGDWIVSNGAAWGKVDNSDKVSSVAGLTGVITGAALKTAMAFVKGDVGLGNVDNTSDLNKPISTATQTALNAKLDDSQAGTFGLTLLGSLDITAAKTALSYTKGDVGLGNVDNTSDANKPVSTAQQTALNLKANLAGAAFTAAVSVVGAITTTGPSAGVTLGDVDLTGSLGLYNSGDTFRVYINGADRFTVTNAGNVTAGGNITINTPAEGNVIMAATGGGYLYGNSTVFGFYKAGGANIQFAHATGNINTPGSVSCNGITTTTTINISPTGTNTGRINIARGGLTASSIFDDGNLHIYTPTAMWFDAPGFNWGPAAGGGGWGSLGLDSGVPRFTVAGYVSAKVSGSGWSELVVGGAANTGYLAFYNAGGTRLGYFGYADASWLYLNPEAGRALSIGASTTVIGNMSLTPASGNATISLLKAGGNTCTLSTDGNTIFVTAPVTALRGATHYFQSENGSVTFGTWTSTVLTVNGDITATSDRRLKKHIAYNVDFGLAEVLALKPVTYRWKKAEGRERLDKEIGLIAQDVEEIFPEFVHTDDETGIKSVDYQKLSVACIAAIKELAARLDKLEARV